MSGEEIKRKLIAEGYQITSIAEKLNLSQPNMSRALGVADVKTGFIEKLCVVLNKDLSFFYGGSTYLPVGVSVPEEQNVLKCLYNDLKAELLDAVRENEQLKNQIALMQKGMSIKEIAQKEAV